MNEKINLTPKKIYNKQFEITDKGYYPLEVDTFLDSVIQDYLSFKKMIESANETITQLEAENAALKQQVESLKQEKDISQADVKKLESELSPQLELIKRVAALETAVAALENAVYPKSSEE